MGQEGWRGLGQTWPELMLTPHSSGEDCLA